MNNNRLSTSLALKVNRVKIKEDIKEFLITNPSNYEIKDGRTFIKSSNTYLKNTRPVSICIKDVSVPPPYSLGGRREADYTS